MKTIILIGGQGTRLRPFTLEQPKCLLPVVNRPLISYQFALLKKYGIKEVILAARHEQPGLAEIARTGKSFSLSVKFSLEKIALGTAGAIRKAAELLKSREPVLVFNGDFIADINLERVIKLHQEKKACATVVLTKVENPSSYGLVVMDGEGKVKSFVEKPGPTEIVTDTINAGVYVLSQKALAGIPSGKNVSIERESFPYFLAQGENVIGCVHYGYWIDVGSIESFWKASRDILDGRLARDLVPETKEEKPEEKVVVEGKLSVGCRALIKPGVILRGYVVIGAESYVGENCVLEDTVLFSRVIVKESTSIRKSFIGKGSMVGANARLENAVAGPGSYLSDFSCLGSF